MDILKKEELCARLPEDVYRKLNLVDTGFSEFHFKKMVNIFYLPGMDQWLRTIITGSTRFLFSLVCFLPPNASTSSQRSSIQQKIAHQLSLDMLYLCFPEENDHSSIYVAMNNFPSIVIFMARQDKKSCQGKNKKSILDYDTCCCLSVANYF
jgi:hypothetical protein